MKNRNKLIAVVVVLCYCFVDSMTDGTQGGDWLTWHIWKWIKFYGIIAYILIDKFGKNFWKWVLILIVPSWLLWQLGVNVICKKGWESLVIKFFKWVF